MEVEEVLSKLGTTINGLDADDAAKRLEISGPNVIQGKEGMPLWKLVLHQTLNVMNLVLTFATVLAIITVQYIDAGVIAVIIVINALIGITQEWKSEKAMDSLKKMSAPNSKVLRNGTEIEIPSSQLVPGDVVAVAIGDRIPADVRLFKTTAMETDEAALTGESNPVEKKIKSIPDPENKVPIGDRINLGYMSTTVTKGKGKGIVIATGQSTQLGKIAESIKNAKKEKTPLQKKIDKLGLVLVIISVLSIGLVLLGLWAHNTAEIYPEGLQVGVVVAVALIPEGFTAIMTLTMTLGVKRMAKRNALVRRLAALESLGNITDICSDKTGTLTQGKMVATDLWLTTGDHYKFSGEGYSPTGKVTLPNGKEISTSELNENSLTPELRSVLEICMLCNNSDVATKTPETPSAPRKVSDVQVEIQVEDGSELKNLEYVAVGNYTEAALLVLGTKMNVTRDELSAKFQRIVEYPFDSSVKMMSVAVKRVEDDHVTLLTKGAIDRILPLCQELDHTEEHNIREQSHQLAAQGLRVLALASRNLTPEFSENVPRIEVEKDLVFLGMVGIKDPPKEGTTDAIRICHAAGIEVHMVTGDHPKTAVAIAQQIGILEKNFSENSVTTSSEFDSLTPEDLLTYRVLPLVIARCSPQSKVQMVEALHARGKVVAMTGDGVNDAPSISCADVGISMAISGSDASKEAADIILLDDDFATLVYAIQEGRRIFENIRKFLVHFLTSNVAEGLALVLGILIGLPPPLGPIQILWVNLITTAPPSAALGVEPASRNIMNKEKRPIGEELFTYSTLVDIAFYGLYMGTLVLVNFIINMSYLGNNLEQSRAVAYLTLTLLLVLHGYNCRRLGGSMFTKGFLKAYGFHVSFLVGVATSFPTLYIEPLRVLFAHAPPNAYGYTSLIVAIVCWIGVCEVYKVVRRSVRKLIKRRKLRERRMGRIEIEDPYGLAPPRESTDVLRMTRISQDVTRHHPKFDV
eukprot:TRINITY_DN397_c0_g1_i1.p1 TRINITY_DN397_c0_g1~~TRINITY_DN397_c0_g1_i1.p1  ORF type:complete len:1009 (+),score=350.20 TRINITY_DN397_c0_g1_i1:100-3027(+)